MSASSPSTDSSSVFVFAGGGSGGHLYPGLAIAEELRVLHPQARVEFVCSDRDIDRQILDNAAVSWTPLKVPTASQIARQPWTRLPQFWSVWRSAVKQLRATPQATVVGTGGFVSVPVVLAARWLRMPIVLLEPNAVPGRATTAMQRFAKLVCTGFPETAAGLHSSTLVQVTGIALRRELTACDADVSLMQRPRQLLILGGSQGAAELNRLVLRVVTEQPQLFAQWAIRHQVGNGDLLETRRVYEQVGLAADVQPFFDPISEAYRTSQLVISRAGATSLAEFACAGLPAVLVPHQQAVRDHQRANAERFAAASAALVVGGESEEARQSELRSALILILADENLRNSFSAAMRAQAHPAASAEIAAALSRLSVSPGG